MPITIGADIRKLSQQEFSRIAFSVTRELFDLHNTLGRLFDEQVYQQALASRIDDVQTEVRVEVSYAEFFKQYYLDALVDGGALFEFKAVSALNNSHRSQVLNYLLLTGLQHGKLVNFRSDRIEHEFVNTKLTRDTRTRFLVDELEWQPTQGFENETKESIVEMLREWGTCLSRSLYNDAITDVLCGRNPEVREIEVFADGSPIARQGILQCSPGIAFKTTTIEGGLESYREHLYRFLVHTSLDAIQWVNIGRDRVRLETMLKKRPR